MMLYFKYIFYFKDIIKDVLDNKIIKSDTLVV